MVYGLNHRGAAHLKHVEKHPVRGFDRNERNRSVRRQSLEHALMVVCWWPGRWTAYHFMHDLSDRLPNRVQLTTDGHKCYLGAVEDAFGAGTDYAMLMKIMAPPLRKVRISNRL